MANNRRAPPQRAGPSPAPNNSGPEQPWPPQTSRRSTADRSALRTVQVFAVCGDQCARTTICRRNASRGAKLPDIDPPAESHDTSAS